MKRSIESTIPDDIEIELREGKIVYSETGSQTIPPSETVKKAEQVLYRIGVEKVEQIKPEFTDGVPIFRLNEAPVRAKCHRVLSLCSSPPFPLNTQPREIFGKGMTVEQSKASGMMEAIERYCAQRFPHSRVINAMYKDVEDYAIHPSEFNAPTGFPPKCENCVERNNRCFQELSEVCHEWSWGFSLIKRRPVLVPSASVYYPYISDGNTSFLFNDTGGLASGNTLEEALIQGTAEVIERDALYYAFNLGNLNHMSVLNFEGAESSHVRKLIDTTLPPSSIFAFLVRNEYCNIHVPVLSAFVCYRTGTARHFFGGSGASLDPEVALLRALAELEEQKVRQKALFEFDPKDLVLHRGMKSENVIHIESIRSQSTGNIREDIEVYLDNLSRNNMDIVAVNLTHPEIGIPVVRILIPQLVSYSGVPIKESLLLDTMKALGGSYEAQRERPKFVDGSEE